MSYLAVVLVVGLLIAIHEFGHLLAAKQSGIPIARFSVGFGPKLFGWKRKETAYWLSTIPLGGYVLPAVDEHELREFPVYKRIVFALGGPFANVVAALAGLLALGVVELNLGASEALVFATTQVWSSLQQVAYAVSTLFVDASQVSGIVGIVAVGGSQFGSTVAGVLTFSVLINMNLAVLNLLPLPPLDGGRILFCVLEKIYQPLTRIQTPATLLGWALVLGLMAYATVQDIGRITAGGLA
ncbi:MAG: site-2 protease family protein [Vicinamibacterales bacterium]|jgi:regulator of sigma E protease|nr:site-2 protease family protein [Vicinamibacterales bacterium]